MQLRTLVRTPARTAARRWGRNVKTLTTSIAALCVAVLVTATPSANATSKTGGTPSYLDPDDAVAARVEDLLRRMTLALAVTPGDIEATGRPEVQIGSYEVNVNAMTAPFTIR